MSKVYSSYGMLCTFHGSMLTAQCSSSTFSRIASLTCPSYSADGVNTLLISHGFFAPFGMQSCVASTLFPNELNVRSVVGDFTSVSSGGSGDSLSDLPLPRGPGLVAKYSSFLFGVFPRTVPKQRTRTPYTVRIPWVAENFSYRAKEGQGRIFSNAPVSDRSALLWENEGG